MSKSNYRVFALPSGEMVATPKRPLRLIAQVESRRGEITWRVPADGSQGSAERQVAELEGAMPESSRPFDGEFEARAFGDGGSGINTSRFGGVLRVTKAVDDERVAVSVKLADGEILPVFARFIGIEAEVRWEAGDGADAEVEEVILG